MNQKFTAFISDLHLEPDAEYTTGLFELFIKQMADKLDKLFILGDLFEYWIGDDDKTEFNQKIISLLASLQQYNIPIYFISGNRDFLIGKKFLNSIHAEQLPDPCPINLYGRSMVLMHGDLLCTDDHGYLKFRKFAHKRWIQRIFLSLPLFIRRRLAKKLRKKSSAHMRAAPREYLDVTTEGVQSAFRVFTRQYLIHGHTHKPGTHKITMNKTRIVLGAWHNEGSMIICNKHLAPKLVKFNSERDLNKLIIDE